MYDINNPESYIPIGNRGDFGHTVLFDLSAWDELEADDWKATYTRPGENATYPVPSGEISVSDGALTWTVSATVTELEGTGSVIIEAYRGGEFLRHSNRIMTIIGAGHEPAGEAPDPVADWIADANTTLNRIKSVEFTTNGKYLEVNI